ncbi:TetR/AcrR family transcriptional regulator [bacterium]|nr:TetR/AcrR family transcriptional regulator [bacterium]
MFAMDTRQQLIEATGRLISRLGYSKTSMGDIAQEAGLSRATAYLYFPNKEALLTAWISQRSQALRSQLLQQASAYKDPWQALEATLRNRILMRLERARSLGPSALNEILAAREALLSLRPEEQAKEAELLQELILRAQPQNRRSAETGMMLVLACDALMPSNLSPEQLVNLPRLEQHARELCRFLTEAVRLGAGC